MASIIYNEFIADLAEGDVSWSTMDFRCALLDSGTTVDADDTAWADVSANEVSGTAYSTNGEAMAGMSVTEYSSNDTIKLDANDVTWQTSNITAYYACIYTTDVSDHLVALIDFGDTKESDGGDFTIQWSTAGIIVMQQS